jgi:hypothetical protein
MRSIAITGIIYGEREGFSELDTRESEMNPKELEFKFVGMLLGFIGGGGIGLFLFLNSGEVRLLAWAGVGAALGLILGTRYDQVRLVK